MNKKIILWDNDGTIMGSKSPDDPSKIILPNVEKTMKKAEYNFIISGIATPESEAQNFDPEKVITRFTELMSKLPIKAAAFSPTIGGVACYVVIKKADNNITIKKAHEEPRYKEYIGQFKKPGTGMFVVMRDIAHEEFGQTINETTSTMIGDTWHDEAAATTFGIPFIHASTVHESI
jgi:hypothetical protein